MKTFICVLLLVVVGCSGNTTRDSSSPGHEPMTIEEYIAQAGAGNVGAQYYLGCAYFHGDGVEKDREQALEWFRRAAEQGHADAQYILGSTYSRGFGINRENEQAFQWFKKAAEQGHICAQGRISVAYAMGIGVKKDRKQAVEWYKKSAELGSPSAQWMLYLSYAYGEGVKMDRDAAYMWINISLINGYDHETPDLCHAYLEDLERNMTPIQIKEGRRKAREWVNTHPKCPESFFRFSDGQPPHPNQISPSGATLPR